MPDSITLNVFLQNSDYVRQLEHELSEVRAQLERMNERYINLQSSYANVSHVNLELVDMLKVHGIKFRKSADIRTWEK